MSTIVPRCRSTGSRLCACWLYVGLVAAVAALCGGWGVAAIMVVTLIVLLAECT